MCQKKCYFVVENKLQTKTLGTIQRCHRYWELSFTTSLINNNNSRVKATLSPVYLPESTFDFCVEYLSCCTLFFENIYLVNFYTIFVLLFCLKQDNRP